MICAIFQPNFLGRVLMIVRTSFVFSGLTLMRVPVVFDCFVRHMVGWAVTGMDMLFMLFRIGL